MTVTPSVHVGTLDSRCSAQRTRLPRKAVPFQPRASQEPPLPLPKGAPPSGHPLPAPLSCSALHPVYCVCLPVCPRPPSLSLSISVSLPISLCVSLPSLFFSVSVSLPLFLCLSPTCFCKGHSLHLEVLSSLPAPSLTHMINSSSSFTFKCLPLWESSLTFPDRGECWLLGPRGAHSDLSPLQAVGP